MVSQLTNDVVKNVEKDFTTTMKNRGWRITDDKWEIISTVTRLVELVVIYSYEPTAFEHDSPIDNSGFPCLVNHVETPTTAHGTPALLPLWGSILMH